MNFDSDFAQRGILVMWLGAVGIVLYKEFGNPNNPDRPLPRPCKLIPPAIGFTGLGLMAQFFPTIAFMVALGITVTELVQQNPATSLIDALSKSIGKQTQAAAAAK